MAKLTEDAKITLREAGVSQAAWAREHFADGQWHGDACGCPDDRCIGFHHYGAEDCGCLVRAGLLRAAGRGYGPYDRKGRPSVSLYRAGDLDALAADDGIGWAAVRATPAGRRSPLTALRTAGGAS